MSDRPGIMFYFSTRPCLKRLCLEQKGQLFEAMLEYGEYGIIPEFDGALGVAWDFVQQMIDRDGERYEKVSEVRRAAANARWKKDNSQEIQMHANNANASDAMQTMPIPKTIPETIPETKTISTSVPMAMATPQGLPTTPPQETQETEMERRERFKKALSEKYG